MPPAWPTRCAEARGGPTVHRRPSRPARAAAVVASLLVTGCSPTLDWREFASEGSGARLLWPCKPTGHARELGLAGARVKLTLHACRAGDVTWALAVTDVGEPARVGPALAELRQSAAANLGGASLQARPARARGATPHPESGVHDLAGHLPGGQPVRGRLAVLALGTRVLQLTALGPAPTDEALDTFFDSLRLAP